MAESVILIEQPEGLPWLVAHNPATGQVAITEALPPWASQELADAVTGRLAATVDTYCRRCEAIRPAVDAGGGGVAFVRVPVPHAEWCPWSAGAVSQLEEACRPRGAAPEPHPGDEAVERLGDYLAALVANMNGPAQSWALPRNGPGCHRSPQAASCTLLHSPDRFLVVLLCRTAHRVPEASNSVVLPCQSNTRCVRRPSGGMRSRVPPRRTTKRRPSMISTSSAIRCQKEAESPYSLTSAAVTPRPARFLATLRTPSQLTAPSSSTRTPLTS